VTTVGGAGELELIASIRQYLAEGAGLDDSALWQNRGPLSVLSTDMYVEGIHFDLGWMAAHDAGWRALALALGDLAAKGARPAWALTSLAVPRRWSIADFKGLFAGMHALAQQVGMALVGGDLSAIEGPAVLSITVAGDVEKRPIPRSDVMPGWLVAVTGPLGAAGLALRRRRPLLLQPRLDEGRRLNAMGICCGDISDGLVREMEKFESMSGYGSVIRAAEVMRVAGASAVDALTGGEEAELVCVGPPQAIEAAGLRVVGEMTDSPGVTVVGAELDRTGYDHFA
jgi:thiamine-monophosphate kinase